MRRLLGAASTGLAAAALACGVAAALPLSGAARPVPVVAPGAPLAVEVGGFATHGSVVIQLAGSPGGHRSVRADRRGRVHLAYRVPVAVGRYRLLVSGPARATSDRGSAPPQSSTSGDAQVISVTVPLVIGVPFQVGGSGIEGVGVHHGSGSSAPSSSNSGTLSTTGSDLREPLIVAAALCLLGLAATLAGRRRGRR